MGLVSQKDSVVNEVKNILGSTFSSSISVKDQLTDDQLDIIKNNVFQGIINGSISYNKELSNEKEVFKYTSGMVSNYLRKAKELNGGIAYVSSITVGSSRDAQLSELNKLSKSYIEGSNEFNQIQEAILARKAELELEKVVVTKEKKKSKEFESINMDALPEGLKNLANSLVNQISK